MEITLLLTPRLVSESAFDLDGTPNRHVEGIDLYGFAALERKARLKRMSRMTDDLNAEISSPIKKTTKPPADDSTAFGAEDTDLGDDVSSDENADAEDDDLDSGDPEVEDDGEMDEESEDSDEDL